MSATEPVARTRFSTDGLPGREGWDAWSEVFAPLFDIRPAGETDAFRAEVDAFDLQKMILTRMTFGGVRQQGVRSRELIRHGGLDQYGIEFCLHNDGYTCEGRHGAEDVHTGHLVVLDLAQESAMTAANSDSISLTVPRDVIESHCPGIERLHGSRIGTPGRARLLGDHMLSLQRNLPHMTAGQADAVVDATAALIGACLAPSPDRLDRAGRVIDQTLLDRAKRCIAGRIDDPRLSPATVCAAVGTSRSNLYRLFQPLGGVVHYIRECRLRRVHAALRNPVEWRSIAQLAYTYGFVNAAHFSRAFRELFGCTPSDIRDLARIQPGYTREQVTSENFVAAWLENLQSE